MVMSPPEPVPSIVERSIPNCSALRLAAFVALGSSAPSPSVACPAVSCTCWAAPTCGVLCLARYLSGLIGGLSCCFLGLPGCLSCSVLHALGDLPHLVRDPAKGPPPWPAALLLAAAGETANGVLRLAGYLTGLVGGLTRGVLGLAGYLAGLIGCLTRGLLGLACYLTCGILGLSGSLSSRRLALLARPR